MMQELHNLVAVITSNFFLKFLSKFAHLITNIISILHSIIISLKCTYNEYKVFNNMNLGTHKLRIHAHLLEKYYAVTKPTEFHILKQKKRVVSLDYLYPDHKSVTNIL